MENTINDVKIIKELKRVALSFEEVSKKIMINKLIYKHITVLKIL